MPKSWVRIPRTLMASIKLSWLLPLTPGAKDTRSLTELRLASLIKSPDRAVMARGTSCTDSLRLVAVTNTSSRVWDQAGTASAVLMRAAETAAVMGFLAIEPLGAWAGRAVLYVVIVFPVFLSSSFGSVRLLLASFQDAIFWHYKKGRLVKLANQPVNGYTPIV